MRTALLLGLTLSLAIAGAAAAATENRTLGAAGTSIADLQKELSRQGYDAGPANGVMTEQTQRAIRAYQRRAGDRATPLLLAARSLGGAVGKVQQALQAQGFLRAPADGVMGPLTRDAIIRFEIARHMRVDPRISDRLIAALAANAPAAAPPAAAPAPAAAPSAAAPAGAMPGAIGRQPLPPGVTPPPIR